MGVDILACYHGCGPSPPGPFILLWAMLPVVLGKRWARSPRPATVLWSALGWAVLPPVLDADFLENGLAWNGALLVGSTAWAAQALIRECLRQLVWADSDREAGARLELTRDAPPKTAG